MTPSLKRASPFLYGLSRLIVRPPSSHVADMLPRKQMLLMSHTIVIGILLAPRKQALWQFRNGWDLVDRTRCRFTIV